ncbi:hypothetical protein P7K49_016863 [Saguinus oedipus]|uniref:Uncharacterized protein n=1 Tax=Saguinus oedipus TaxID=9490 RepID=A0ABQ9VEN8_SAGOE|nr:hypothetical protein P7K49_016863 [Saguinus oedipus]
MAGFAEAELGTEDSRTRGGRVRADCVQGSRELPAKGVVRSGGGPRHSALVVLRRTLQSSGAGWRIET